MNHLRGFNQVNEGKISQAAIGALVRSVSAIQSIVKSIKGTYVPLNFKDKKLERKVSRDIIEVFDYAVFDTLKYYFSKKYKREATKTNLTTLIKQRCGVDVYQKIDSILSNMTEDNLDLSSNPEIRSEQLKKHNVALDTVKKMKGMFKKTDDDIAEMNELIKGLTDIMKDLDPRNPNNLFRDKEESIDALGRGLTKLDDMQKPKNLDDILDKVSKYGIDSLTDTEREDLDKHSKKESKSMKYLKRFNEGTYQAHSTIPDANSKAIDRLQAGTEKYGHDSKFMREYKALCQQARYDELDTFFAKWGIQASNEAFKPIRTKSVIEVEQPSRKDDPGNKILMDLLKIVDSIGHDDIPFTLDWSDNSHQLWKDYLVKTYGPDIKNHEEFLLLCY